MKKIDSIIEVVENDCEGFNSEEVASYIQSVFGMKVVLFHKVPWGEHFKPRQEIESDGEKYIVIKQLGKNKFTRIFNKSALAVRID